MDPRQRAGEIIGQTLLPDDRLVLDQATGEYWVYRGGVKLIPVVGLAAELASAPASATPAPAATPVSAPAEANAQAAATPAYTAPAYPNAGPLQANSALGYPAAPPPPNIMDAAPAENALPVDGDGDGYYESEWVDDGSGTGSGYYRRRGSSRSSGSSGSWGGGSSGGGYSSGGSGSSGGGAPDVMYADGYVPIMFGGNQTRQEWLAAKYGSQPDDGPTQLPFVPRGGASLPPPPAAAGSGGGGGGGGGGGELYQAFRDKLVGGMLGSGSTPDEADYRKSQARQRRDQRQMTQDARGMQRLYGMMGGAQHMIPDTLGFQPGTRTYDFFAGLDGDSLMMLGQAGRMPMRRFEENPNRYKREVAQMWNGITSLDQGEMLGNLFSARRKSLLGRQFQTQEEGQAQYSNDGLYQGYREGKYNWAPANSQAQQASNLLGAVWNSTLGGDRADVMNRYTDVLLQEWQAKNYGKRKPGNALRYLGRRFGY